MTTKTNKRLQQNQSNNLGKLPIWDLSDLYNSSKDNKITSDLNFIKIASKKFEKKYEGKIRNLNSEKLHKAIIELEKINEKIDRVMSYAHLLYAENEENEKNKIFFQKPKAEINLKNGKWVTLVAKKGIFDIEKKTLERCYPCGYNTIAMT